MDGKELLFGRFVRYLGCIRSIGVDEEVSEKHRVRSAYWLAGSAACYMNVLFSICVFY
jgi:hypothetical protein